MSTSNASGTRDRLVAHARALIEEAGVGSYTGREVARRAGVSHGAPRRYFPKGSALLATVVTEAFDELAELLDRVIEEAPPEPSERVRAAALAFVSFAEESPNLFELMFRHDLLVDSGTDLRMHSLAVLTRLRAVTAPCVGDADVDGAVLGLWTNLHGIATLHSRRALEVAAGLVQVAPLEGLVDRALAVHLDTVPR